jgi:hypothetical protein
MINSEEKSIVSLTSRVAYQRRDRNRSLGLIGEAGAQEASGRTQTGKTSDSSITL